MRLIRQKSDYFKQYKLGIISKSFNNRFKAKVNKEIVKAKNEYYIHTFDVNRNNVNKSWKTIKNLLGQDSSTTPVKELIINGISHTSDADLAEQFSNYFSEVATKLESQLPPSSFSPKNIK